MKFRHVKPAAHRSPWLRLCLIAAAIAAVLAGIYYLVPLLDPADDQEAYGSLEGRFDDRPSVAYNGVEYVHTDRLASFLFIGVDKQENDNPTQNNYRSGGQSDFLMLLVVDDQHKKITRIQIDRDTMAEITVLGVLGNDLGTRSTQICLSHAFGDGGAQSCRYTVEAVERLMCGIDIDGYYAMNMDGIAALNDLLGGVTVTIEDDFSHIDPAMTVGATLALTGAQAERFVRGRMEIGDGTNAARMRRQGQFLTKAMERAVVRMKDSAGFIGALLDGIKPYVVTDMTRGRLINEANKAGQYESSPVLTPSGEHTIGEDGFVEFHADEDAMTQLVLDVFYTVVQ